MEKEESSHTKGQGTTSGDGSPRQSSASYAEATATKSQEELSSELESLRKSVQGLSAKNKELEDELKLRKEDLKDKDDNEDEDDEGLDQYTREGIRKEIHSWWSEYQENLSKENEKILEFQNQMLSWRKRLNEEFPEINDPSSELFKKAKEIYEDPKEGLSVIRNGMIVPSSSSSEYDSVVRASLILQRQNRSQSQAKEGATFASTGGKGSQSSQEQTVSELSDEDFLRMSPEQQRAYQYERARANKVI